MITTSLRTSPLTNTFIKVLSRLLNAPILRRGTSNLDEIAYFVASEGYEGFIVVYTREGTPSVITFYKLSPKGFFELYGRLFLFGIYINRKFKKLYDSLALIEKCSTNGCEDTYAFLKNFFDKWIVEPEQNNFVYMIISDLEEYRERWLNEPKSKEKLNPVIIEFVDPKRNMCVLRLKVHHVWRSLQK